MIYNILVVFNICIILYRYITKVQGTLSTLLILAPAEGPYQVPLSGLTITITKRYHIYIYNTMMPTTLNTYSD